MSVYNHDYVFSVRLYTEASRSLSRQTAPVIERSFSIRTKVALTLEDGSLLAGFFFHSSGQTSEDGAWNPCCVVRGAMEAGFLTRTQTMMMIQVTGGSEDK